jgi:hypothetical protein
MGLLEEAIKAVIAAAPQRPGNQISTLYLLLNVVLPIILGVLLTWVTKLIEKALTLLIGARR